MATRSLVMCLLLQMLIGVQCDDVTKDVVKAVVEAERKQETQADKKADAAVDATINVLKTESIVPQLVEQQVLNKAKADAKDAFEKLDNASVGTHAAADVAAKVAVAEIEGASNTAVGEEVKENAEKAAVAAGVSVADHPNSLPKALSEAAAEENKENAQGKVDLKEKKEGIVSKAEKTVAAAGEGVVAAGETVAELPVDAVEKAEANPVTAMFGLLIFAVPAFIMFRMHNGEKMSYLSGLIGSQDERTQKLMSVGDDRELGFTKYNNFA